MFMCDLDPPDMFMCNLDPPDMFMCDLYPPDKFMCNLDPPDVDAGDQDADGGKVKVKAKGNIFQIHKKIWGHLKLSTFLKSLLQKF